ncbi:MFS transporter [Neiella sp. HB171785]|uniref:MFS transporter n=1 Tax=Neiella litorisoli TaxID=2771431 RepID=A0A8J6QJI3_9GAMM|nr:MFS transporter [Neiella litorisoli]
MLTAQANVRRSDITILSGAYFTFFAIVGLMVPYLSVYLDRLGYDSQSIGELLAMVATMRIIGPSLWSAIADKTGRHILVARIGGLCALLSLVSLFWLESRLGRLIALAAFNLFWTAVLPQVEVITLRKLAVIPGMYGKVRSAGSLGFIVISTLAGVAIADYGADAFVAIGVILAVLLLANLCLVAQPKIPQQQIQQEAQSHAPFWSLALIGLVTCSFLIQTSHGAYYSFFILYMVDLGYSEFAAGWLVALGVLAEIVLFWRIGSLFSRFRLMTLFQAALVLTCLRWLLMSGWADIWPVLTLSLLLHAASFGIIHACSMRWLHHHIASAHHSKAQALYSGTGFGAGSVAGPAVVAPLWQQGAGAMESYLVCAGIAALAIVVFQLTIKSSAMNDSPPE